jgi:hypothetical protein
LKPESNNQYPSWKRKLAAILFTDMTERFCPDLWFGGPIFRRGAAKIKDGKSIFDREDDRAIRKVRWTFQLGNPNESWDGIVEASAEDE